MIPLFTGVCCPLNCDKPWDIELKPMEFPRIDFEPKDLDSLPTWPVKSTDILAAYNCPKCGSKETDIFENCQNGNWHCEDCGNVWWFI